VPTVQLTTPGNEEEVVHEVVCNNGDSVLHIKQELASHWKQPQEEIQLSYHGNYWFHFYFPFVTLLESSLLSVEIGF